MINPPICEMGELSYSEMLSMRATLDSLAQHMKQAATPERTDMLWPADVVLFQTNPLSLAHGACGTALFLHHCCHGGLDPACIEWIRRNARDNRSLPPGLYTGSAGVAWTLATLGFVDEGIALLLESSHSPLLLASANFYEGQAGWGFCALRLYLSTGLSRLLELACRAADELCRTASTTERGMCWKRAEEDSARLGFAYGSAGIAFFLLTLWEYTGIPLYLNVARAAMAFDLSYGVEQADSLVWGTTTDTHDYRPYWLRGGAGVLVGLVRFAGVLQDPSYLDMARKAAAGCCAFFSAGPHLFEGLASMGDALLDMYLLTKEVRYLEEATLKAKQVLLYSVVNRGETVFPGRFLMRISHDYGMGGAGIGMFLLRVLSLSHQHLYGIPMSHARVEPRSTTWGVSHPASKDSPWSQ